MLETIIYSLQLNAPDQCREIEKLLRDEFYSSPGDIKLLLANVPIQSTDIGLLRALEARLVPLGARPILRELPMTGRTYELMSDG